jgi:hypothetical protein
MQGVAFGDGVRCVGGTFVRLGTKQVVGGNAQYPVAGDPSITQRAAAEGAPITPGSTRYYFAYYRDAGPYACFHTFNVTNAAAIAW